MKILQGGFMGSSSVSVEVLGFLLTFPEIQIKSVWTNAPRPSGRGQQIQETPVATFVKKTGNSPPSPPIEPIEPIKPIELREPERIGDDEIEYLKSLSLDFLLVVAYGHILPKPWLSIPRLGCFNIHFSLLPRYRGASPIQAAILNGDEETGITLQKMDVKLDTGDIVLFQTFSLVNLSAPQAFTASLKAVKAILPDYIRQLKSGNVKCVPQRNQGIPKQERYCYKIKKKHGHIHSPMGIPEVFRKFLAYQPWPGIFFQKTIKGNDVTIQIQELEKLESPAIEDIRSEYGDGFLSDLLTSQHRTLALIEMKGSTQLLLMARRSETPLMGDLNKSDDSQIQCLSIITVKKSGKNPLFVKDFLNGAQWKFPVIL